MKRSVIRESISIRHTPDCVALHPGYNTLWLILVLLARGYFVVFGRVADFSLSILYMPHPVIAGRGLLRACFSPAFGNQAVQLKYEINQKDECIVLPETGCLCGKTTTIHLHLWFFCKKLLHLHILLL